jgi:type II secretory pathway pseudopilin PulG
MNRGFTLVETIIYTAIVGTVISGFVVFTFSIGDSRNKNYVVQEVQGNSRVALDFVTQRVRASEGVNIGSSTFGSDPGVLSLQMADAAKNPTLISLSADDGQLQIKEGASAYVNITSDEVKVTNLVFTNLTGTSDFENVQINATIEFNNTGTDVHYDFTQSWQTAVSARE